MQFADGLIGIICLGCPWMIQGLILLSAVEFCRVRFCFRYRLEWRVRRKWFAQGIEQFNTVESIRIGNKTG
ncbi:hypothetical protein KSB_71450 [Ktedonobacter robiniae]|uniref:Uncharacterized protein n=1 Tax=Ktedonobacter robiniae TaxID=2778365 RepID=A0ABQ3V1Z0_9CHLR|nr:hypothetical protein KSB_71450 [Ktedonobacter robiniae]